jgi:hypothetical protein
MPTTLFAVRPPEIDKQVTERFRLGRSDGAVQVSMRFDRRSRTGRWAVGITQRLLDARDTELHVDVTAWGRLRCPVRMCVVIGG